MTNPTAIPSTVTIASHMRITPMSSMIHQRSAPLREHGDFVCCVCGHWHLYVDQLLDAAQLCVWCSDDSVCPEGSTE